MKHETNFQTEVDQVTQDLENGLRKLKKYGWTQRCSVDRTWRICAMQAIQAGAGWDNVRFAAAAKRFAEANEMGSTHRIIPWNDADTQTFANIERAFQRAIAYRRKA